MERTTPNRVWKVASRWSATGHASSSVLDIFRSHGVVFVGKCQAQFGEVREGDLVAVSSGLNIVALGVVASAPCPVTEVGIDFTDEEKGRFDYEDWVLGCRLSFTDWADEDWLPCRQGTFHEIHEQAAELRRIYSDLQERFGQRQEFDIRARSCTLLRNSRRPKEVLWQRGLVFKVPVYQRPVLLEGT